MLGSAKDARSEIGAYGTDPLCGFLLARLKKHHAGSYHHSWRVAHSCMLMCGRLGYDAERTGLIVRSALLHDIGHIHLPTQILNKGKYPTQEEWIMLMEHPAISATMAEPLLRAGLADRETIMCHHENLDGTGYLGIDGVQLSEGARLIRICDSFDALTVGGGFRQARLAEHALEEMYRWRGIHYDDQLLDVWYAIWKSEVGRDGGSMPGAGTDVE